MKTFPESEPLDDARLVQLCLAGQRDAFSQVVTRYQSLICGLAYSACGDVGRSEDLAQETFIAAWKGLGGLQEPGKLKSWLCGIARNLIHNSVRAAQRTPTAQAEPLPAEISSPVAGPHEAAAKREEELLIWRTLESIPADYREPLILFYREGRSTEAVAAALDLSEEAVRQRLSRGRAMLNERVTKTVESALLRSAPGKAFTLGVLAALPAFTLSAKAATLGATAAHGSATAKVAATTGLLGALLSPLLVIFGMWVGYRMNLDAAHNDEHRKYIREFHRRLILCLVGFGVGAAGLILVARPMLPAHSDIFVGLMIALVAAYLIAIAQLTLWSNRMVRKAQMAVGQAGGSEGSGVRPTWEYRSQLALWGLPLVHVRMGGPIGKPVKAWIAAGDSAVGVLFAFGGLAVAPISVGGVAIGLFSFGGLASGAWVFGGTALGVWACGGLVVGWQAFGGCALAWDGACGGFAVARNFALGGFAEAAQANTAIANSHLGGLPFFRIAGFMLKNAAWINLFWLAPMLGWWALVRSKRNPKTT